MAKELLVESFLSDAAIDAGERLVRGLDDRSARVMAAFWMREEDDDPWRLVIVSPLVNERGPLWYYEQIDDVQAACEDLEPNIALTDITVAGRNDRLAHLLMQVVETGSGFHDRRVSGCALGDGSIHEAFVYRMQPLDLALEVHAEIIAAHREWLNDYPDRQKQWESLLSDQPQAAMAEAAVQCMLSDEGFVVQPHDTGPDFHCTRGVAHFNVEVTTISIGTATRETGLRHFASLDTVAVHYNPLTESIYNKCTKKARQCADRREPTLLAICTFHSAASALCFDEKSVELALTGEQFFTWIVGADDNANSPEVAASLGNASFLREESNGSAKTARRSISGLLLCGFGIVPPTVVGALHPDPARPFQPEWLPSANFCRIEVKKNRTGGRRLTLEWLNEEDDTVK